MPFWTKLYNDKEYTSTNRTYQHAFYIPSKYQVCSDAAAMAKLMQHKADHSFPLSTGAIVTYKDVQLLTEIIDLSYRGKPQSPPLTKSGWFMSQAAVLIQGNSAALQQVHWSLCKSYAMAFCRC